MVFSKSAYILISSLLLKHTITPSKYRLKYEKTLEGNSNRVLLSCLPPSHFHLLILAMHSVIAILIIALSWTLAAAPLVVDSNTIKWVNCRKHVPTTLDTSEVDLAKLPSTLHRGQIDVPMDYTEPMSASNKITLGLAMYRPVKPKGVLFV